MATWNQPRASLTMLLYVILFTSLSRAAKVMFTTGTDVHGVTRELAANRYPALYTGDYGDCMGGQSLFSITKFDAAYYADNMTIVLHMDGTSSLRNESLMMRIAVDAYGENRFDMVVNPCNLNIASLCPVLANVPVRAWAEIRVGPQQIGGIPDIAYEIPDFEGTTRVQFFANSSQKEVACFQAVMKNGNSLSHAYVIAPFMGLFTMVAIIASFFTATYGISVPHMRMHHAHSLSVFIVFETFQTIFFSGALSVNWPSILIAWWTNFAWSAGFVYAPPFVQSINSFAGVKSNSGQVGGSGPLVINTGEGLIGKIYGRSLMARGSFNATDPWRYEWGGDSVAPGLPLPGAWIGFPATLAAIGIPAADAFVFGLLWFLIAVALVVVAVVSVKVLLELLASARLIKEDRLAYFRSYWVGFLGHALLRALIVGFFMLMTLTMFQFSIQASVGTIAVAVVLFFLVLMGVTSPVAYGVRYRTRHGTFNIVKDRAVFYRSKWRALPIWETRLTEHQLKIKPVFSIPLYRLRHDNHGDDYPTVHLDQPYVKRFAWLAARYRRTRWWYLAYYVAYLFVRAAFLGGAGNVPIVQVYGVLALDMANFAITVIIGPFEGARNTAMGVWILNICKILTTSISIAFLPQLNVNRIITTVLGVIIIVIQGFTVIALIILIILSALSSRLSLLRNQEEFTPRWLDLARIRYFEKMQTKAQDRWKLPSGISSKEEDIKEPTAPPEPHFAVTGVRRGLTVEDEFDDSTVYDSQQSLREEGSNRSMAGQPRDRSSQAGSIRSRLSSGSLPRTGRVSRMSWSSREFVDPALLERPDSTLAERLSGITFTITPDDGSSTMTKDNASVSGESSISRVRPQASFRSFRSQSTSRASSINEKASTPTPTREAFGFPALNRPSTLPEAAEPDE
ncbi:putative flavin carrier protein 2 precursor [Triangularia setosa]|uniref:Flavin carrier protein 2 n=1 Tax=Triangularia setosa TaxID=2587417 RepID=A0AAN6W922_9PEZI|nr:putative flavin carrier protein 2 precursor [Podospora setosa]